MTAPQAQLPRINPHNLAEPENDPATLRLRAKVLRASALLLAGSICPLQRLGAGQMAHDARALDQRADRIDAAARGAPIHPVPTL